MADVPQARFASSPLFLLSVAIALGICVGNFTGTASKSSLIAGALAGCGSVSVSIVLVNRKPAAATALVLIAFFCAGISLSKVANHDIASDRIAQLCDSGVIAPGEPVEITASVRGEPEPAPDGFFLTLQSERVRVKQREQPASGTLFLTAATRDEQTRSAYDALELHHGARVRLMTSIDREEDFRNPGVRPFTEYLERKGYDATGIIKSPLLIERLEDASVFLPLAWLYEWRARLQSEFSERFSADTAGVLNAALLGNPHNISRPTAERFRAGGTFHVLVISGMQIVFIAGVALLIVRRLTKHKAIQFFLAAAFIWAYAIAVGGEASVVRAALMFTVAALAPVVARRASSLNTIGAAALALLIWQPADLFDPSFQLTFLSVLAIVCLTIPLLRSMQRVGSWKPTMATPYPPDCPQWFRVLSELLYWREREWRAEMAASNIKYRLFKTPFAARLERWRLQTILRFAVGAVMVSASVQIMLLPLMVIYFHRISLASLILNIFVGGLMATLGALALVALVVSQLSLSLTVPIVALAEKVNWLMIHLIDPFAWLGAASVRLPHYSGWKAGVYALYYLALAFLLFALAKWNPLKPVAITKETRIISRNGVRLAAALLAGLVTLMVLHPFSASRPDGKLHVAFLDVGQGDAALLTLPDGTTMLIDGGGKPNFDRNSRDAEDDEPFEKDTRSIGERVVSEYLWARGLDRVDYLVVTHADADHIDGMNDIARNFGVRGAIVARAPVQDPEFIRFGDSLRQAAVPVEIVGAGDLLEIGDVSLQVLWPLPQSNPDAASRNNDSLVLRIQFGEKYFLFTGDIEKLGEGLMLTEGINFRSDIVKVPHHGSRTSSTAALVQATRPSLAVISVGRNSMFGHPHQEVVERWGASGAQVMTTGAKGTISVVTDGRMIEMRTFVN
jgi:competence protein ComEC